MLLFLAAIGNETILRLKEKGLNLFLLFLFVIFVLFLFKGLLIRFFPEITCLPFFFLIIFLPFIHTYFKVFIYKIFRHFIMSYQNARDHYARVSMCFNAIKIEEMDQAWAWQEYWLYSPFLLVISGRLDHSSLWMYLICSCSRHIIFLLLRDGPSMFTFATRQKPQSHTHSGPLWQLNPCAILELLVSSLLSQKGLQGVCTLARVDIPMDLGWMRCYSTFLRYESAWSLTNRSGATAIAIRAFGLKRYQSYLNGDPTKSLQIPLIQTLSSCGLSAKQYQQSKFFLILSAQTEKPMTLPNPSTPSKEQWPCLFSRSKVLRQ